MRRARRRRCGRCASPPCRRSAQDGPMVLTPPRPDGAAGTPTPVPLQPRPPTPLAGAAATARTCRPRRRRPPRRPDRRFRRCPGRGRTAACRELPAPPMPAADLPADDAAPSRRPHQPADASCPAAACRAAAAATAAPRPPAAPATASPTSPTAPSSAASTSPPATLALPRAEARRHRRPDAARRHLRGRLRRAAGLHRGRQLVPARRRRRRPRGRSSRSATCISKGRGVTGDRAQGGRLFREGRAPRARSTPCTTSPSSTSRASARPRDPTRAAALLEKAADARQSRRRIRARPALRPGPAASRRTSSAPPSCSPTPPARTTSPPRSNTPSACSTASASPRTRRPRVIWFRRAADLGNAIAQNRLARILATGTGAPADPVEAAKYHFLASARRQDRRLPRQLRRRPDAASSGSRPLPPPSAGRPN